MVIGIIGAGASGMAAAIAAAAQENVQVLLLERQARVGHKLQATGNGRCNLTNLHAGPDSYHGTRPEFAAQALCAFPVERTLAWFHELGLLTVAEPSGRVYPYSDQANSVVDVLRFGLEKPNITLKTGFEVRKVRRDESGFTVEGNDERLRCDRLIIACGGLAGTRLGGSLSGYQLLQRLGHGSTALRPALVQLRASWSGCAALKGVRANCRVQLCRDGQCRAESTGQLQFTEYGLSGPVIFEISRDACREPGTWSCVLDFLPQVSASQLLDMLEARAKTELGAQELLTGVLHNRLGRVLTKAAGIDLSMPVRLLQRQQLERVCRIVKEFEIALTEPMGMDCAQVTAGGVYTRQFAPRTMESLLVPGLYACGEVLDIDGDCGGYNLQWAWSSGFCAGTAAGGGTL